MINISKRLKMLAKYAYGMGTVADIGCDHALLDIYLIENNYCGKVICSDINPKPLENAKKNIKKYGYEKRISVIMANGISHLNHKVDLAFLAGMGGILICNILEHKNIENLERIVIQANSDVYIVRKFLMVNGFRIVEEKIFQDKDIYYSVIYAIKGKESLSEIELTYGPVNIKKRDEEFIEFLHKQKNHYQNLLTEVPKASNRYAEICKEIEVINSMLNS